MTEPTNPDTDDSNHDGVLSRRRLFQVGGLAAAAAGLSACINGKGGGTEATTTTSTTLASKRDVTRLRTASSIEALLVEAYQKILDAGLVTTPAQLDAVKLFQTQHKAHLVFFESATERGGGKAFADPNPTLAAVISQQLAGLKSERDAVQLAYALEKQAAATHQAAVGNVDDVALNEAIMSVGATEVRHVAVLAPSVGQSPVGGAFSGTDGAIAPGTGGT
jgi:hypothetical protein